MTTPKLCDFVRGQEVWRDRYSKDRASPADLMTKLVPAKDAGEIGVDDLHRIAHVKSPRRAALVLQNPDDFVRKVTRIAFDQSLGIDEESRVTVLCALKGVRVPMASAILSWVYPERWPVIDRRAWSALAEMGFVDASVAGRLTAAHWGTYCELVLPCAAQLGWTPQKLDRWLYAYARDRNLGETP